MRLFLASLVLISTSAMACPDISGSYTCRSQLDPSLTTKASISQNTSNGVTTYKMLSVDPETGKDVEDVMIADGKIYTENDGEMDTAFTTTCQGNTVVVDGKVLMDGSIIGGLGMTFTKNGSVLISTVSVSVLGIESNDTLTCE